MSEDQGRPAARAATGWARSWEVARGPVAAASVLVAMVAVPYAFLWTLFWIASGSWDVEGSTGLRHWLLVKGSRLDQLGLVAPTARPPSYSVRFQEGTFPGWRVVGYESSASPSEIVAAYIGRCGALGLKVTKSAVSGGAGDADATQATLVCEIEPYIDAEFHAERKVSAAVSSVSVRVWGSQ